MEQAPPRVKKGAEAVLNLEPNSCIPISYHPHFGPHDDLIVVEIDDKVLSDVLQQRVTLRGQPDEDAVLCTQSKTFALKFVGTSNSSFLIPPLRTFEDCDGEEAADVPVIKVVPGNMELVEVAAKIDKLKLLLSENPYGYVEVLEMEDYMEEESRGTKYKWDDLVERVQASDEELRNGLLGLSAVEIDGFWRIVDEKYMDMILRMLLHNSVLNDWSLDFLNEDKVVSVLVSDGFPPKIARHCLCVYGNQVDGDAERSCVWRLDERRVSVHFARQILNTGKKKMESFMEEWLQKIPGGMQVSFDMLEGEVLTEKIGLETWVYSFSVSSLPSTPADRFSMLFRERSKWDWKDLEPYIRDLNVPGLSSEGLLLKYTRRTQPILDAEPVFTER